MLLHCWSNTVQIETPVKRSTTLWRCQSKQSISLPTGSCSFVGAHQPNQNSDYRQITAHTILTWSDPRAHMSCRCSWLSGAILCKTPTPVMKFMVISLIKFSHQDHHDHCLDHQLHQRYVAGYLPIPFARLLHTCSRPSPINENMALHFWKKTCWATLFQHGSDFFWHRLPLSFSFAHCQKWHFWCPTWKPFIDQRYH